MISKNEIKYIQTLYHKKNRDAERLFIAEGAKLVNELLQSDMIIKNLYATRDWIDESREDANAIEVSNAELARISALPTPNGALAIVEMKKHSSIPKSKGKLTLVLDGIQDPGNFGTIIRTADWFGINNIIASDDTADIYNDKVVRSTMGSIARVNVFYTDIKSFLKDADVPIYGALLDGKNIHSMNKIKEGLLVIGNESKGIREEVLPLIQHPITIPRTGHAESLNAAVAAGVILFQFT